MTRPEDGPTCRRRLPCKARTVEPLEMPGSVASILVWDRARKAKQVKVPARSTNPASFAMLRLRMGHKRVCWRS